MLAANTIGTVTEQCVYAESESYPGSGAVPTEFRVDVTAAIAILKKLGATRIYAEHYLKGRGRTL
jgi:hypothetical protein